MKKITSIFIAMLMMLSLGACGLFRPAGELMETSDLDNTIDTDNTVETTDLIISESSTTEPISNSEAEPARVSFIGCGDNIIYYGNVREAATKAPAGRNYSFAYSYERVAHIISSADVAFINQETLMCGDGYDISYYPTFNSPRDVGYDLVNVGFDVVNIANNHMLDKTGSGLERTIEFWKEQPVLMIGGYESEEDFNTPRFLESGGLRIAFLSYTYGTNGFVIGDNHNAWVPYLYSDLTNEIVDETAIRTQTSAARTECDILIVSVHWGKEGSFVPSESQKECAKFFADCGVDVIVGHHPHVIQPVEWIEGEMGNKTLCVYSLGNFMAEQAYDYNMVGGMISFNMVRTEENDIYIENVLFIPTVFHHNSAFYDNQVWLMEEYTADMASSHGISYYGNHTSLDRLKKYVTDTVSPEFLPGYLK